MMDHSRQQGTGNADALTPGEPFTIDELRKVLERTKSQKWIMPETPDIKKLASILTFWKRHFYAAQQQRGFNEKLAAAETAILTLRDLLPEIYQYRAEQANAGDPFSKNMAKSAERLLIALDFPGNPGIQPAVLACVHRQPLPDSIKDWRWLIRVLPIDFKDALLPANPKAYFGRSRTGPLARFLEAIIPAITGDKPSAAAIGQQLMLMRVNTKVFERDPAATE